MCGVYRILCSASGRFYVGSSSNLDRRYYEHRLDLRKGRHRNPILQSAWSKYGEDAFEFETIAVLAPEHLIEYEQRFLDALWDTGMLYNVAREVTAPPSWLGRNHTAESRRTMSEKAKARYRSTGGMPESTKRKLLEGAKARLADGWRPVSRKGQPVSKETRAKLRASHLAKGTMPPEISPETRRKLLQSTSRTYPMVDPKGDIYIINNMKDFCRRYGFKYETMLRAAQGKNKNKLGWRRYES